MKAQKVNHVILGASLIDVAARLRCSGATSRRPSSTLMSFTDLTMSLDVLPHLPPPPLMKPRRNHLLPPPSLCLNDHLLRLSNIHNRHSSSSGPFTRVLRLPRLSARPLSAERLSNISSSSNSTMLLLLRPNAHLL